MRPGTPTGTQRDHISYLTRMEYEVLALMAEGCENAVIARQLLMEKKTVEVDAGSIYSKLNVTRPPDLDRRAHAVLTFLGPNLTVSRPLAKSRSTNQAIWNVVGPRRELMMTGAQ